METQCAKYNEQIQKLEDHTAMIKLFNAALKHHTKWPSNDAAVLQKFDTKQLVHLVMKMGFYMNIYSVRQQKSTKKFKVVILLEKLK